MCSVPRTPRYEDTEVHDWFFCLCGSKAAAIDCFRSLKYYWRVLQSAITGPLFLGTAGFSPATLYSAIRPSSPSRLIYSQFRPVFYKKQNRIL